MVAARDRAVDRVPRGGTVNPDDKMQHLAGTLERVQWRGTDSFTALCPAHPDRHPSLSVRRGDRGLLVKCWSGCSVAQVVGALNITVRDLFFDQDADPREIAEARRQRAHERHQREQERRRDGRKLDALREADNLIQAADGIDISGWSNVRLDSAINALADAYQLLEWEHVDGY
jgi:hypothetical protein